MKPISITLHRFGSFVEKSTFTFPNGPGLYFLEGINKAEPRLGSNGAGKSTIWSALTWVLFGKDAQGLKAGNVANWSEPKGALVDFQFDVGDDAQDVAWMRYCVTRTHAPNSWTLTNGFGDVVDLARETANPLMSMLRLEFTAFLNSILIAQGEDMFLDLKAEPKAALFAEIMQLDKWLEYAARASRKASDADAQARRMESIVAKLKGQLEQIDRVDHQQAIATWEENWRKQMDLVELDFKDAMAKSKGAKFQIDGVVFELTKLRDDAAEHDRVVAARVLEEGLVRQAVTDLLGELRVAESKLTAAEIAIETARVGEVCPTCNRPWHVLTQADRIKLEDAADVAFEAVGAINARLKIAEGELVGARNVAQEARKQAQEARDRLAQGVGKGQSYKQAYEAAERELDRLEQHADRLARERNPYAALADAQTAERMRVAADLDEASRSHVAATERCEKLGFWVRGFKDIRLKLIAQALGELEIEAGSELLKLGLVGWELRFEVDRETASGSISRGFSVFVKSPHNDKQVPWESWSGGEAQRLRLAVQTGLANLIRSRTGADLNLEVWDEPTAGMSAKGIEDLLDSLAERARRESRQIWVVDHRSLGYGGFDGVATVIKDDRGSRFINGERE